MPRHEPEKYLYDMLSSCEFLLGFTAGKAVDDYVNERAFRSAVERELRDKRVVEPACGYRNRQMLL